ncbi:MAG: MMPL family transporter, partial [Treponema sp.]|nr:MMPL family transporter [Treponema sp.]
EQFGGSKIVSVVAESEDSLILLSPACLGAMDKLNRHLEDNVPEAGKAFGFTDLIKRINQVFNADESPEGLRTPVVLYNTGEEDFGCGNFGAGEAWEFGFGDFENDPVNLNTPEEHEIKPEKAVVGEGAAYYEIPADPAKYGKTTAEELAVLTANYLILLSGSIDSYANDPLEPTAIKTTIQLRTLGESDTNRAMEAIYNFMDANFPRDIKITVGGSALVEASLNRQVVHSQIISLFISLALVFLIIALTNRSVAAGFIGIVPLSISILMNFAVMGFLGIKLNLGTSMIASLAVGIGIDYTIHYMESFKRELRNSPVEGLSAGGQRIFLMRTFAVSGKAIIINALSVGAGFAVLIFSRFNMLADFGLLIAITMGISALVSLTVIPALLLTLKPAFAYKQKTG